MSDLTDTLRLVVPTDVVCSDDTINVSREGQPITDADVADLAADLAAHGQREPVGLVAIEAAAWLTHAQRTQLGADGYLYLVVYGFRRVHACRLAQRPVRAEITIAPLTVAAAELANLGENWGAKPPTEYQLAWAVHRMVTVHHLPPAIVAPRVNRRAAWIAESVLIFDRVDPALLTWYRANCSGDTRRKMIALAAIEGADPSRTTRYRTQAEQWRTWEAQEATARRADPQGGIRPRGPDKQQRARHDLRTRIRGVLDTNTSDANKLIAIGRLIGG